MDEKAQKIRRISYRVTDKNPAHVRLSIWVNGGLICSPGGICLRLEEFDDFIERLKAKDDSKL